MTACDFPERFSNKVKSRLKFDFFKVREDIDGKTSSDLL